MTPKKLLGDKVFINLSGYADVLARIRKYAYTNCVVEGVCSLRNLDKGEMCTFVINIRKRYYVYWVFKSGEQYHCVAHKLEPLWVVRMKTKMKVYDKNLFNKLREQATLEAL